MLHFYSTVKIGAIKMYVLYWDWASFLGNDRSFTRTIPLFRKKNERTELVLKNVGRICKGTEQNGAEIFEKKI